MIFLIDHKCNNFSKFSFKSSSKIDQDLLFLQQPIFTKDNPIITTPTLFKELPAPLKRFVGTMAAEEKVLLGLNLKKKTNKK